MRFVKWDDMEFDLAFLPSPKYNEDQDGYRTLTGSPMTLWGVISNAEKEMQEECTAVLECLAYNAYLYTTPAVYKMSLMDEDYEEDTPKKKAFQMVRDGLQYEQGRILDLVLGTTIDTLISDAMLHGTPRDTLYAEYGETIESQLRAMNETFRALKEQTE